MCLTAVPGDLQDALPDSVGVCQLSGTVRDSSTPLVCSLFVWEDGGKQGPHAA